MLSACAAAEAAKEHPSTKPPLASLCRSEIERLGLDADPDFETTPLEACRHPRGTRCAGARAGPPLHRRDPFNCPMFGPRWLTETYIRRPVRIMPARAMGMKQNDRTNRKTVEIHRADVMQKMRTRSDALLMRAVQSVKSGGGCSLPAGSISLDAATGTLRPGRRPAPGGCFGRRCTPVLAGPP